MNGGDGGDTEDAGDAEGVGKLSTLLLVIVGGALIGGVG